MERKMIRIVAAAFCLAAFVTVAPFAGSGQAAPEKKSMQDVKKEVSEAAGAIKGYSASQRDKAVQEAGKALTAVDAEIERTGARIRANWARMDRKARAQAADTMKELSRQRNEAAEWFGGLKHSSDKAWEDVKGGFLKSYESLQQGIRKAAQRY